MVMQPTVYHLGCGAREDTKGRRRSIRVLFLKWDVYHRSAGLLTQYNTMSLVGNPQTNEESHIVSNDLSTRCAPPTHHSSPPRHDGRRFRQRPHIHTPHRIRSTRHGCDIHPTVPVCRGALCRASLFRTNGPYSIHMYTFLVYTCPVPSTFFLATHRLACSIATVFGGSHNNGYHERPYSQHRCLHYCGKVRKKKTAQISRIWVPHFTVL